MKPKSNILLNIKKLEEISESLDKSNSETKLLRPRKLESRRDARRRIDYNRVLKFIENGIWQSLDLTESPLTKLPDELLFIRKDLLLGGSDITELPSGLTHVGADLEISNTKIKYLPKKIFIGDNLFANGSSLEELPQGLKVMGSLFIRRTPLSLKYTTVEMVEEYLESIGASVEYVIRV